MAKVYFVRHQAHGIVADFPFAETPTEVQLDAVKRYCFHIHGFSHPKTPTEPYWVKVVEFDVLGPGEVPSVPERALGLASTPGVATAEMTATGVSGTGVVSKK